MVDSDQYRVSPVESCGDLMFKRGIILGVDPDSAAELMAYERIVQIETGDAESLDSKGVVCCVTAYNEDGAAMLVSLLGLIRNAQYLASTRVNYSCEILVICVVVDGVNSMSSSFFDIAKDCGFVDDRCFDGGNDVSVFESYADGSQLASLLTEKMKNEVGTNEWLRSNRKNIEEKISPELNECHSNLKVRTIFYIKKDNKGKLDSHWHFFEVICPFLNPRYCVQMDVGTNPNTDAIEKMLESINRSNRVGAVACRSFIPEPENAVDLMQVWQYADMVKERVVLWPTEVLLGYLSVMPGQLCMMKWEAVDSRSSIGECAKSDAECNPRSETLNRYYRGLEKNGPFESNMFLAEDRILGYEIMHNKSTRWKIDYAPESEATTDACNSWGELLQQRRRWICGDFSCKVWLLCNFKKYLSDATKSTSDRFRMMLSSVMFFLHVLTSWFAAGVVASSYVALHDIAQTVVAEDSWLSWVFSFSLMLAGVLAVGQVYLSSTRKRNKYTEKYYSGSVAFQSAVLFMFFVTILVGVSAQLAIGKIIALLLCLPILMVAIALYYSASLALGLAKHIFTYSFITPAITFVIQSYAFLNADDVSWGTKGLNSVQVNGSLKSEDVQLRKKQFTGFKRKVVVSYLGANGIFFLWAFQLEPVEFLGFLVLMSIASLLLAVAACFYLLARGREVNGEWHLRGRAGPPSDVFSGQ